MTSALGGAFPRPGPGLHRRPSLGGPDAELRLLGLPAEPPGQRQDQPQELGEVGHGPGVREGSEGSWGVST